MIISMRNLSYEALKNELTYEDKIVLYSCNACVVACNVGGTTKLDELETMLKEDGYNVIGKDLISMGCVSTLVDKRKTDIDKKRMYAKATIIVPLICEDGYQAIRKVFEDKKVIETTQTLGVGRFTPDRGTVLTTPFESTGIKKSAVGYTLTEVAEMANLYADFYEKDESKESTSEKVNLVIDGQNIMANKDEKLLDVCVANGIDIPRLCHHGDLKSYGACRMCVVKIDGFRDLAASCCVTVDEGMKVVTSDDEIESYRKMTLELLMSSGDHNCLTCTKGLPSPFASCELQSLVRSYGITESRFETLYDKKQEDNSSEVIYYDANKCILCGRCVRACEEVAGLSNLGFINRGEKTVVVSGLNKTMNQSQCVTCMACTNVCPTGALIEKVVRFTGEEWCDTRPLSL